MERDLIINSLKENLVVAHNRMKKQANLHWRELRFQVGDEVYLKLWLYRQMSRAKKRSEKLSPKLYGPYRVMERIGKVAYRLELPSRTCIHDVFHVSQLKKVGSNAKGPKTSLHANRRVCIATEVGGRLGNQME